MAFAQSFDFSCPAPVAGSGNSSVTYRWVESANRFIYSVSLDKSQGATAWRGSVILLDDSQTPATSNTITQSVSGWYSPINANSSRLKIEFLAGGDVIDTFTSPPRRVLGAGSSVATTTTRYRATGIEVISDVALDKSQGATAWRQVLIDNGRRFAPFTSTESRLYRGTFVEASQVVIEFLAGSSVVASQTYDVPPPSIGDSSAALRFNGFFGETLTGTLDVRFFQQGGATHWRYVFSDGAGNRRLSSLTSIGLGGENVSFGPGEDRLLVEFLRHSRVIHTETFIAPSVGVGDSSSYINARIDSQGNVVWEYGTTLDETFGAQDWRIIFSKTGASNREVTYGTSATLTNQTNAFRSAQIVYLRRGQVIYRGASLTATPTFRNTGEGDVVTLQLQGESTPARFRLNAFGNWIGQGTTPGSRGLNINVSVVSNMAQAWALDYYHQPQTLPAGGGAFQTAGRSVRLPLSTPIPTLLLEGAARYQHVDLRGGVWRIDRDRLGGDGRTYYLRSPNHQGNFQFTLTTSNHIVLTRSQEFTSVHGNIPNGNGTFRQFNEQRATYIGTTADRLGGMIDFIVTHHFNMHRF